MQKHNNDIELRLFGTARLTAADGTEIRAVLSQPKRFALLVYLAAAAPRGFVRRDSLLAIFWPDFDTDRARAALRDSLYFLRRHLGDAVITRGADEAGIDAARLRTDVTAFQDALREGRVCEALNLYTGPLLEGFNLAPSPDFEDWLDRERTRLRGLAADAAAGAGDVAMTAGDWSEAAGFFRRSLELEPYRETVLHRLMDALERAGDHAGALAHYEAFTVRIARELETGPSDTTRGRADALRTDVVAPRTRPTSPERETRAGGFEVTDPPAVAGSTAVPAQDRRWFRNRSVRYGALAVLLAVALALPAAWKAFIGSAGTPALQRADVVVLPFTIHGGPAAEYLREGMIDLFGAKLNGLGGVRSVDPQALMSVMSSLQDRPVDLAFGRDVAHRFGAAHFVMGSVVQAGGTVQVSAYLYDAEGQQVSRADRSGPDSTVISMVDDLTRELLAGTFSGADRLAGLAALTTHSLDALRAHLDGERLFRSGDFEAALDAYQRATVLDTTFALAYYRLSSAANWLGRADVGDAALQAAVRHGGRLPPADRQLVAAREAFWFGDASRAENLYVELTRLRPTDVEALFELAEVRFHAGPWFGGSLTEAEGALRQVLALQPQHVAAMVHLARVAAATGRTAMLDSVIAQAAALEPAHSRNIELRALRAALRDQPDSLQAVIAAGADIGVAERVAVYTANLEAAAAIASARLRTADPDERERGYQSLALIHAGQGDHARALQHVSRLAATRPALAALVRANILTVPGTRASAEALAAAERDLRERPSIATGGRPAADPAHYAAERREYYLGLLALMRGDSGAAEAAAVRLETGAAGASETAADAAAEEAVFARSLASLLRARALTVAGDSAAALQELERGWAPPRKPLMVGWAWTYSNVNARLLRAMLLLQQGRHQEAAAWAEATREDIAGSPLVLRRAADIRARARRLFQ